MVFFMSISSAHYEVEVKTDADEDENHCQEGIRRAPSPTRSPTVRSGKRMLHETPPPLDTVHQNSNCIRDSVHGLPVTLLDTAEGDDEFNTSMMHADSASHVDSSTFDDQRDIGMTIVNMKEVRSVENGDDSGTARMLDEALCMITRPVVGNLIEPLSPGKAKEAFAWTMGEEADKMGKVNVVTDAASDDSACEFDGVASHCDMDIHSSFENGEKEIAPTTTANITRSSTPSVPVERKIVEHKIAEPIQIDVCGAGEKERILLTGLLMRHPEPKKLVSVASYRESLRMSGGKRLMHLSTSQNSSGGQRNDSEMRPPPLIRSVAMPARTVSGRDSHSNNKYCLGNDETAATGGIAARSNVFTAPHAHNGGFSMAHNTPTYYNSRHNHHQPYQSQTSVLQYGTPSSEQYQPISSMVAGQYQRPAPVVTDQHASPTHIPADIKFSLDSDGSLVCCANPHHANGNGSRVFVSDKGRELTFQHSGSTNISSHPNTHHRHHAGNMIQINLSPIDTSMTGDVLEAALREACSNCLYWD